MRSFIFLYLIPISFFLCYSVSVRETENLKWWRSVPVSEHEVKWKETYIYTSGETPHELGKIKVLKPVSEYFGGFSINLNGIQPDMGVYFDELMQHFAGYEKTGDSLCPFVLKRVKMDKRIKSFLLKYRAFPDKLYQLDQYETWAGKSDLFLHPSNDLRRIPMIQNKNDIYYVLDQVGKGESLKVQGLPKGSSLHFRDV